VLGLDQGETDYPVVVAAVQALLAVVQENARQGKWGVLYNF
jgi:hypothetical protein